MSIDNLPDEVKIKTLGKGRPLSVQLTLSEPATVTIAILSKKQKVLRTVIVDRRPPAPSSRTSPSSTCGAS